MLEARQCLLLVYIIFYNREEKQWRKLLNINVVLKLSGEALAGDKGFGINPIIIKSVAHK